MYRNFFQRKMLFFKIHVFLLKPPVLGFSKRIAMSVYISLILSDYATLDVIFFHCDFCILKATFQSSNGTIEVIQMLLALLLKHF